MIKNGQFELALQRIGEIEQYVDKSTTDAVRFNCYSGLGQWHLAAEYLDKCLASTPHDVSLIVAKGEILLNLQGKDAALKYLNDVLAKNPQIEGGLLYEMIGIISSEGKIKDRYCVSTG